MWFIYILECQDGSLYTGVTTDVERRFTEHQNGTGGHYTRTHHPIKVVYTEKASSRSDAQMREAAIKKLPVKEKWDLFSSK